MNVIDYIIGILLLVLVGVLLAGFGSLLTGKDARRSNRLMFWRVAIQALIVLIAAMFMVRP